MSAFIIGCLITAGVLAWYTLAKKRQRKLVWNRSSKITLTIIVLTFIIMFALAAIGSTTSIKLF